MKKKPITAETPTTPPLPETAQDQDNADEKTRIVGKARAREMAEQATVAPSVERRTSTGSTPTGQAPAFDNGPLRAGTRIAEFEITEVVAQGGFGIVYKAWDHILERTVALKEYLGMSPPVVGDPQTIQGHRVEACRKEEVAVVVSAVRRVRWRRSPVSCERRRWPTSPR